jgi:hypothetical protein
MAPSHRGSRPRCPGEWKAALSRGTSEVIYLTGNAHSGLHALLCCPKHSYCLVEKRMERMRTTMKIGGILGVAAFLGSLALAGPVDARDGQASGVRDSVVPIVVISAAPAEPEAGREERAKQPEDRRVDASDELALGPDIALDPPVDVWAPLVDVPLAAWFLLGTCFLCAGFGPRAMRGLRDDAQDTAPTDPQQAPKSQQNSSELIPRSPG